jgi:hypothetical protein
VLEPTDYIIGPAEGNPDLCLSWPKASPPSADGIDWLLGIVVWYIFALLTPLPLHSSRSPIFADRLLDMEVCSLLDILHTLLISSVQLWN